MSYAFDQLLRQDADEHVPASPGRAPGKRTPAHRRLGRRRDPSATAAKGERRTRRDAGSAHGGDGPALDDPFGLHLLGEERHAEHGLALTATPRRPRRKPINDSVGLGGRNDKPDVRWVQRRLHAHGFYKQGKVDGLVGDLTIDAIKAFQKKRGIQRDGVVDPGGPTERQLVLAPPRAEPGTGGGGVRQSVGDGGKNRSKDVRWVQQRLRAHRFYKGGIDGVVGDLTIGAIKAFQKKHGITRDGLVEPGGPTERQLRRPPPPRKPPPPREDNHGGGVPAAPPPRSGGTSGGLEYTGDYANSGGIPA